MTLNCIAGHCKTFTLFTKTNSKLFKSLKTDVFDNIIIKKYPLSDTKILQSFKIYNDNFTSKGFKAVSG